MEKYSVQLTARIRVIRLYVGVVVALGSFLVMIYTDSAIIFLVGYPVGVLIAASDWIVRKVRR